MERIRLIIAEVQSRFAQLSERERRLVAMMGTVLALVLVFVFLFSFSNSASGYRRRTEDKLRKLAEAQALAISYREAETARVNLENQLRSSNVSLVSYVEEKANAVGVSIPTQTPHADVPVGEGRSGIMEGGDDITLQDIPITKLVSFLAAVEQGPGIVKVKRMRIEPRPSNQTLTARMTISTYRMKPQ